MHVRVRNGRTSNPPLLCTWMLCALGFKRVLGIGVLSCAKICKGKSSSHSSIAHYCSVAQSLLFKCSVVRCRRFSVTARNMVWSTVYDDKPTEVVQYCYYMYLMYICECVAIHIVISRCQIKSKCPACSSKLPMHPRIWITCVLSI